MKEGFLLGGGLVIVGLLLQWLLGPVTWDAFAWPVNGIVLAAFLLLIAVLFLQSKRVYALTFLGSYQAAVPALCYAVLLTVSMDCMRCCRSGPLYSSTSMSPSS